MLPCVCLYNKLVTGCLIVGTSPSSISRLLGRGHQTLAMLIRWKGAAGSVLTQLRTVPRHCRPWSSILSASSPSTFSSSRWSSSLPAGALEGVRVLDLTRILAGPFTTMLLGDMGAEVIKLEQLGKGDETRRWGPPFVESSDKKNRESCYFLSVNRNKKSICVDIKSEEGVEVVQKLALQCDVVIENFVPGKLDALGLGYESLSRLHPSLIYCSISGFGPNGPYAKRAGFDLIAASIGGLVNVTGQPEGPPNKVGIAVTDICTGLYAHGAIMAALLHRHKSGKGQKIDCDLLSTQVTVMSHLASNYLNAKLIPHRMGNEHPSIVPYQIFATSDGHMTVAAGSDAHFKALCLALDRPELMEETKFATNELRVANKRALLDILEKRFKEKSNKEWNDHFVKGNVAFAFGVVNNMEEVFSDQQVKHLGLETQIHHELLGAIKMVAPGVQFSECRNEARSAPPPLGFHTESVLQDIVKLSANDLQKLRAKGIIN